MLLTSSHFRIVEIILFLFKSFTIIIQCGCCIFFNLSFVIDRLFHWTTRQNASWMRRAFGKELFIKLIGKRFNAIINNAHDIIIITCNVTDFDDNCDFLAYNGGVLGVWTIHSLERYLWKFYSMTVWKQFSSSSYESYKCWSKRVCFKLHYGNRRTHFSRKS